MRIVDVVCSPGRTGFFFDDQAAIKAGALSDGLAYKGKPETPGFKKGIRIAGEAISVMLILEDGQVAHGDCTAVQYCGAAGRDPLFLAEGFIPIILAYIKPLLVGRQVSSFRELAFIVDSCKLGEKPIHSAIRYGVTQAILDAVAKVNRTLMAKVVAKEYHLSVSTEPIPIFSQSGDDRYNNVDKMIIKALPVLPHGLFNSIDKLGHKGEKLLEYIGWLRGRIAALAPYQGYAPSLHLDVYGTIGQAFNNDLKKVAAYFAELEKAAAPFELRIEGPLDMGGYEAQIDALAGLRRLVDEAGIDVGIVADEWCNTLEDCMAFGKAKAGHMLQIKTPDLGGINNTIEAVLVCKKFGIGAYIGGSCNETERSAQVCTHIAMATSPHQMLAKPGMGVDEGFMICFNEMNRILALTG